MLHAIEQWIQGVKNAAFDFRPMIYRTDAVPTHEELQQAAEMLSRLVKYGGFIKLSEEMYAQVAEYALEHFKQLTLTEAQRAAARDAITNSLQIYYNYDPAIGNGIDYQMCCFLQTMKDIDKAIASARPIKAPLVPRVEPQTVVACTTPYYKHNEPTQQKFKYDAPKQEPREKLQGTLAEILEGYNDDNIDEEMDFEPSNNSSSMPTPTEFPKGTGFVPTSSMLDDLLSDVDFDD